MSDQQIIITVSGIDKVGIVAKVSAVLAEYEVNIEDINDTTYENSIIIAFSIFLFIRLLAKLNRKKEEVPAPAAPPAPSKEEVLLTEIRDLLKEQAGKK